MFRTSDIITVFGDMDDYGFNMAEARLGNIEYYRDL